MEKNYSPEEEMEFFKFWGKAISNEPEPFSNWKNRRLDELEARENITEAEYGHYCLSKRLFKALNFYEKPDFIDYDLGEWWFNENEKEG